MLRRAFTLIEMLVVIAIIAVLAAILTSALLYGIGSSKNSVCESNLHQIQLAMSLYEQDSGAYPPYVFWDIAGTFESHFEKSRLALQPYVKSSKIYGCPSDRYFDQVNPYLREKTETSYTETLQAFSCGQYLNVPVSDAPMNILKSSDVTTPSSCGLLTDYSYSITPDRSKFGTAHGKFVNAVYVDGHTKHLPTPYSFTCK